jgi:hypothetical protein
VGNPLVPGVIPLRRAARNWTQRVPVASPPVDPGGLLAYDAAGGYVVDYRSYHHYTWTYSGGNWTNATHDNLYRGPPRGGPFLLAYDSSDRCVVLYTGTGSCGSVQNGPTWTFSGGSWTNVTNRSPVRPSLRASAA